MTIAVGISALNHVIIAADSQEGGGRAGDMKSSAHKVALWVNHPKPGEAWRAIAVTGAGDAAYLSYIQQEIAARFMPDVLPFPSLREFEQSLRSLMVEFYDNHCLPFSQVQGLESLGVELIIGAVADGRAALWTTSLNTVRWGMDFVAVGAGAPWALSVLRSPACYPKKTERESAALALYSVFLAKENSEGCGKETSLVVLRTGASPPAHGNSDEIRSAEAVFHEYGDLQQDIIGAVTGQSHDSEKGPAMKMPPINQRVKKLAAKLMGLNFTPY